MELVVFISHIFNDYVLNNYLIVKNNLLNNQKLIWLTTDNSIIDIANKNKEIESKIEFLYLPITIDELLFNCIQIDPNPVHPNLTTLYLNVSKIYDKFDYYWFIEYDVKMYTNDDNNSFKEIFRYFQNADYDIIADHIKHVNSNLDCKIRYGWFINQLPQYNIDSNDVWKAFYPICRLSKRLLDGYDKSDDPLTFMFFEMGLISFAKKYEMKTFSLDTNNLFSVENVSHPFILLSPPQRFAYVNTGSNGYNKQPFAATQYSLIYHNNTIIHAIKNSIDERGKFDNYNNLSKEFKIWVCGDNFELPNELDKLIYNKFDLSKQYKLYNVNYFNKIFSEFVMMYYVYANNIYSKYIGTAHYHRYPLNYMVNFERIENNEIQVFYFFDNRPFRNIESYEYPDFALIEHQVTEFDGPRMLIYDMIDYLKSNPYIDVNKIIEYTKHKDFVIYFMREMFVMKWEMFREMVQFVEGYIHFVSNKYNIYSLFDWIEHVKLNVIDEYRKPKERNALQKCYQFQPEKFDGIHNENYGYGISNCWRVYSYMIEMLISIFIGVHNKFYVPNSVYEFNPLSLK